MKRLLVMVTAAMTLMVLIFGQMHWSGKTKIELHHADAATERNVAGDEKKDIAAEQRLDTLISFTANWPEEAAASFADKLRKGEPYKILFAGSEALGDGEESWPKLVEERMNRTYGDVVQFAVRSYNLTSTAFVDEGKVEEIIAEEADLILFEPFTLKDNGRVVIETSWANTRAIMEAVEDDKDDTVFILQPPHPIYNASWYLTQIESLENYAGVNQIPYWDHWQAWPDTGDEELTEYLDAERSVPNEKGHQLWAGFLLEKFIANGMDY